MQDELKALVNSITPTIYRNMQKAVETGRWPDGREVTAEQKQNTLQAIIAYEQIHFPPEQRTGYLPKSDCSVEDTPIKWKN